MKMIIWQLLVLKKREEVLNSIREFCNESFLTEFSIVDVPEEERKRYGANTKLVTLKALSDRTLSAREYLDPKREFAWSREFQQEKYAGAFVDKGITVTDLSPEDKARFNVLLPRKERRAFACAEVTP